MVFLHYGCNGRDGILLSDAPRAERVRMLAAGMVRAFGASAADVAQRQIEAGENEAVGSWQDVLNAIRDEAVTKPPPRN